MFIGFVIGILGGPGTETLNHSVCVACQPRSIYPAELLEAPHSREIERNVCKAMVLSGNQAWQLEIPYEWRF